MNTIYRVTDHIRSGFWRVKKRDLHYTTRPPLLAVHTFRSHKVYILYIIRFLAMGVAT